MRCGSCDREAKDWRETEALADGRVICDDCFGALKQMYARGLPRADALAEIQRALDEIR